MAIQGIWEDNVDGGRGILNKKNMKSSNEKIHRTMLKLKLCRSLKYAEGNKNASVSLLFTPRAHKEGLVLEQMPQSWRGERK